MRWSIVLLCLAQAGCALSDGAAVIPQTAPDAAAIALNVAAIAAAAKLPPPIEVSAVRAAHPLSPAEWMFCMKSDAPDQVQRYAVFMKGKEVAGYRSGVLLDRCEDDTYKPLAKTP
jgi:hypothetical protein